MAMNDGLFIVITSDGGGEIAIEFPKHEMAETDNGHTNVAALAVLTKH